MLGEEMLGKRWIQTGLLVLALVTAATVADYIRHYLAHGTLWDNDPTSAIQITILVATPISWFVIGQQLRTRRAQQALAVALEEARAAIKVKSDFLANMTHELRTPLNAIIGFSGVLKDAPDLDPKHARQVAIIWEGSRNLLQVINDVLDYSRLEADAVEFDSHPFSPAEMARSTATLLAGQAEAKGLALDVIRDGDDAPLLGDQARLRQVLMNFISNAIKFTAQGDIRVEVSQRDDTGGRRLRVAVTDQGIGIAPDQLALVFDRFTQADASVSRRYGGTGLGLAIAKRIIEGLDGRIGVESTLGRGSTFWFEVTLPQAPVRADPPAELAANGGIDTRLKLLVVDDNPINQELIAALMEPFEVSIVTAGNGVEAIEAAGRETFDIILMDVQMPVMDGLAATRHIRAMPNGEGPRVPIIAMTANVLPEQIERCLQAGMDAHLGKPIDPAQLLGLMSEFSEPAADPGDA